MSELRNLRRELEGEILIPDFEALLSVAERRHRRRTTGAAAGVGALLVAAAVVATARLDRPDASPPAQQPTQTLSPADQRRMADLIDNPNVTTTRVVAPDDPGSFAQGWTDCRTNYAEGGCSAAIRVTSAGKSGNYLLATQTANFVLEYLRDGLFWYDGVNDALADRTTVVVDASGAAPRRISWGDLSPTISKPAAGWDVVSCGSQVLCRVNLTARIYAPLDSVGPGVDVGIDADHGIVWSTSHDPLLWAVTQRGQGTDERAPFTFEAVWFTAEGVGQVHTLATDHTGSVSLADGGPAGLLAFYLMAGTTDGTQPSTQLHTSADRGETWQVRQVPDSARTAVQQSVLAPDWSTWAMAGQP
ncbi:MAG: hypothetical protein ABIO48_15840 [Pedococcus sp.]